MGPIRTPKIDVPAHSLDRLPASELKSILDAEPPLELESESTNSFSFVEDWITKRCTQNPSAPICRVLNDKCTLQKNSIKAYVPRERTPILDAACFDNSRVSIAPLVLPIDEETVQTLLGGGVPLAIITEASDGDASLSSVGLYCAADSAQRLENMTEYANGLHSTNFVGRFAIPSAFAEEYAAAFDDAADIVAKAHPDVGAGNLKLLLLWRLFNETFARDAVDVWQDAAACRAVSCPQMRAFEETFPAFASEESGGLWQSASIFMNSRKQGLGPMQVIVGMALEAAAHKPTSERYRDKLTEEELTTIDGATSALLDAEKSVYYTALVYDFLLTRLKETIFRDPRIGVASDRYPFPLSRETARKIALMEFAQRLSAYPEDAPTIKDSVSEHAIPSFWADFFFIGELEGVEPDLPGVKLMKEHYERLSVFGTNDANLMQTISVSPSYEIVFLVPNPEEMKENSVATEIEDYCAEHSDEYCEEKLF